jgi:hypothetical protein
MTKKKYDSNLTARNFFLHKYTAGDPLTLSQRVTALKWQETVAETIRVNMAAGADLTRLTKELSQYTTVEDVNKTITEIERMARRIIGGDTAEYATFQRMTRSVKDDALQMIEANDVSRLGKAYAKVANAADSLKESGLDMAIENAIEKKALSNAFRLATTEINKTVNLGSFSRAVADEDVEAMELVLSSAGNNCEECEELAELDNGAGPGIYPIDEVPETPVHPRCRCLLLPVYKLQKGADPDFSVDSDDYDGDFMQPMPEDLLDEGEEE